MSPIFQLPADTQRPTLPEILISRGKLTRGQLDRALRLLQEAPNETLTHLLITLGLVAPTDLAEALAEVHQVPLVRADTFPELPILEDRVSPRFLRESIVLPLHETEDTITLAVADPGDNYIIDAIAAAAGKTARFCIGLPQEIESALDRLYSHASSSTDPILNHEPEAGNAFEFETDVQQLKDLASEAPVIRLVSLIISNALATRASDIHIEPFEDRLAVRYRIDGVLHEIESPP
ncbi:MAG: type II secretion system protein GspE, partial [Burkholderiales bacterium]|nr:type II secretion system protein GspE [Burkholderiales bacterium]